MPQRAPTPTASWLPACKRINSPIRVLFSLAPLLRIEIGNALQPCIAGVLWGPRSDWRTMRLIDGEERVGVERDMLHMATRLPRVSDGDCATMVADSERAVVNKTTDSCPMRLYIHSLPDGYRDAWSERHQLSHGSEFKLYATERNSLGPLFYQRALEHPCRTRSAEAASLFLVPIYRARQAPTRFDRLVRKGRNTHCAEQAHAVSTFSSLAASVAVIGQLRLGNASGVSVLEAHGGADHVLLNVQDGMWWETTPYCEFDYLATALGAATRLAHTGMYGSGEPAWRYPENYLDSSHGTRAYLPQLQASPAFNSIPYPSFVHLDATDGRLHPSSCAAPDKLLSATGPDHKRIVETL